MRPRISLVQFGHGRFNCQLPAIGHGIGSVDRKVHDDLFDLAAILQDRLDNKSLPPIVRSAMNWYKLEITTNFWDGSILKLACHYPVR